MPKYTFATADGEHPSEHCICNVPSLRDAQPLAVHLGQIWQRDIHYWQGTEALSPATLSGNAPYSEANIPPEQNEDLPAHLYYFKTEDGAREQWASTRRLPDRSAAVRWSTHLAAHWNREVSCLYIPHQCGAPINVELGQAGYAPIHAEDA